MEHQQCNKKMFARCTDTGVERHLNQNLAVSKQHLIRQMLHHQCFITSLPLGMQIRLKFLTKWAYSGFPAFTKGTERTVIFDWRPVLYLVVAQSSF